MGQLQERYKNYREPQKYMAAGVYLSLIHI